MKAIYPAVVTMIVFACFAFAEDSNYRKPAPDAIEVPGRWPAEKAQAWYAKQPWLVGCNYIPANAINQLEMWQAETFDLKTIDKELQMAEDLGFNTLRVFLHDLVWAQDPAGLYGRMDQFLTICARHGIKPVFVFFDDCHWSAPKLGPQPLPVPGFHNSGWVTSPAFDTALKFSEGTLPEEGFRQLKGYVQETMRRFKDDARVLMWELYNEPGRIGKQLDGSEFFGDRSAKLVYQAWVWAREVNPSQPVCSCADGSVGDLNIEIAKRNSDINSFHVYAKPEKLEEMCKAYAEQGRPALCTEYLARTRDSTFESNLPVLKKYNMGAFNWGFVSGKTGTVWPWSSRKGRNPDDLRAQGMVLKPGDAFPEPEVWFHDIYRVDGSPYKQSEIDFIKQFTRDQRQKNSAADGKVLQPKALPPRDYPVVPVPFAAAAVSDSFWTPRMETNRQMTVWYDFKKCEETGRIDNFAKAGGLMPGEFRGNPYDDSDVYKVIEGAAYSLATHPDPKLDVYLDGLIAKISAAQEADGYLYTARTLKSGHKRAGSDRWLNERGAQVPGVDSHELYNLGHLYEAAAAHFEATGKTNLLHVALRSADLVASVWGEGKVEIPSGHQEVEIGLVKLYRVTGQEKYLNLAKFLLNCRGNGRYVIPSGGKRDDPVYYADHQPVTQQTEAVGHAVRSVYMYSAMADVAAITGDAAYTKAIDLLWENVVSKKLYLTGGIGAQAKGESFGGNYELPNDAYNETCAAIANALWNQRMFLLHGDAKYADVLERIIYNGFLSGVAMTGDKFFYPNPLVCDGQKKFNNGSLERAPWFGTSCCPVNDVRFIPEIAGYIYAARGDELYVNLFIGGDAKATVSGTPVKLTQQTRYPWDGQVALKIDPAGAKQFALNIRIPGWARNEPLPSDLYRYDDGLKPQVKLAVNGKPVKYKLVKGYAQISRKWQVGDTVTLNLEMPVRRVAANPKVSALTNSVALERGPLVYCAEGADNDGKVLARTLTGKETFITENRSDLLGGIVTVKASGTGDGGAPLTFIPYYAWCHRGPNEMCVWMPARK